MRRVALQLATPRPAGCTQATVQLSRRATLMAVRLAAVLSLAVGHIGLVHGVPELSHRQLQSNSATNGDCGRLTIRPDGQGVAGSVDSNGQNVCYTLAARQGSTYTITADLNGLDDSILTILAQDGSVLAENDDADDGSVRDCLRPLASPRAPSLVHRTHRAPPGPPERSSDAKHEGACRCPQGTLGSQVEWTAPSTANYYVVVRAYSPSERGAFILTVAEGQGPGQANDPCAPGSAATGGDTRTGLNSGVISFTDSYAEGATCTWTISCDSPRDHVELVFATLDVEQDYDFVDLFDGQTAAGSPSLAHLSGSLADVGPATYDSSSNNMVVQLTSDDSINGDGFELQYTCLSAAPAPPTADIPIQSNGQPVAATESGDGQWFTLQATVSLVLCSNFGLKQRSARSSKAPDLCSCVTRPVLVVHNVTGGHPLHHCGYLAQPR